MSRRSFPHIDPADLRQHADDARVERVWQRVEHDLASRAEAGRARSSLVYLAIAAAFGAFGAGLLAGKATWDKRPPPATTLASPAPDKLLVDVLAAGTQSSQFPLPGGGRLTLSPGATVELERAGSAVTLSLLQGEASVDSTGRALTIVAGDARINTQSGSVFSIRRNADDVDVKVDDGSVSVTSPAGRAQTIGKSEHQTLPLHTTIAVGPTDAKPQHGRAVPPRHAGPRASVAKAAGPEWMVKLNALDYENALAILQKQGVADVIANAGTPAELDAIADLMRGKGKSPEMAIRAFTRIIEKFPGDQRAYGAAKQLASMYSGMGNAAKAEEWQTRSNQLAQNITGRAADSIQCISVKDQMRTETDKTKAAALAKGYLDKYPDGVCHEEFEQIAQSASAPVPALSGEVPPPAAPVPAP